MVRLYCAFLQSTLMCITVTHSHPFTLFETNIYLGRWGDSRLVGAVSIWSSFAGDLGFEYIFATSSFTTLADHNMAAPIHWVQGTGGAILWGSPLLLPMVWRHVPHHPHVIPFVSTLFNPLWWFYSESVQIGAKRTRKHILRVTDPVTGPFGS